MNDPRITKLHDDAQALKRELEAEMRAVEKVIEATSTSNVVPLKRRGRPRADRQTA